MSFLKTIRDSWALDFRSLALYRFLMGLVVIADVLYRWVDIENFYTDKGLIPRNIFIGEMTMPWSFSVHLANGTTGIQMLLFMVHLVFGILLVVGLKTRWAMIGAFIMTVSVHNRNWLVNNGGDDILRAILFISIFLPLNKTFSLDSALTLPRPEEKKDTTSTWAFTFLLQVFCIYFISYILKDHPIWNKEYSAVFYSSRLDIFATDFSVWLRNFPFFQVVVTFFTIWLEFLGSVLLAAPFIAGRYWYWLKLFVIISFWGLHLGIIATMKIGVFPYMCLAMWTIFIPGPIWDRVTNRFRKKGYDKLIINYDGECRFCLKSVLVLKEFFLLKDVRIERAQDNPEVAQVMSAANSWVITDLSGKLHTHFDGFLELVKCSPVLRPFHFIFASRPIRVIGGIVYGFISTHRELMGRYSQFLELHEPKKQITWFMWIREGVGAFVFAALLMWNLGTVKKWNIQSPRLQNIIRWVHLYQEWNMFAPFPKMDNVWVEIPAVLSDGSQIELLTGDRDIYSNKSQRFYQLIPSEHWRKFYLNLSEKVDYARYYGGFLCRQWNERKIQIVPDVDLRKLEIIVYSQMNLATGERGPVEKRLSWKHWCFDDDYKREALRPKD